MAGKSKLDDGPMLLGGLDLDDIDDFLTPKSKGKMSPKEAVKVFAESSKKGFRKHLNTQAVLSGFMRTALPDGYVRLLGLYDETGRGLKTTLDNIEDTEAAALEQLAEKFEDQLPKLKGKLPDAVYERVKSKIEERKDQYKFKRQIDQARHKDASPLTELDRESSHEVEAMFDELSEAQLDLAKATGDVEHSRLEYEVKKDGIRAKLDKHRFDAMDRHLGLIADATLRQTTFNDSVTYKFQKRSLELQMRSYLALRSLVRLTGETHQLHRDAYTALVHNTALPEHRKSSEGERTKFNAKQAMYDPFRNSVNKTASDFAVNFLPQLFNNLGRKGASALRGTSEVGEGLLGTMLRRLMSDPVGNAGSIAGEEAGRALLNRILLPQVARRVQPRLQRASDRYTGGLDSRLAYGLDNMASLVQQFTNDSSKSTGMTGYLQDALRLVAPQFKLNDLVKDHTYQTIDQAASFNQMTQRSITEIIPGYLSRILHETRMIRTGDHTLERESYDITRGQFVSDRKSQDHLSKRIIGRGARMNMAYAMNSTIDSMDTKGTLSPEAKHALEERLLRDAMEGRHFDPENYLRGEGYAPGTDAAVITELGTFFKRRFKFDEKGALANNARNYRKRQEYSAQFNLLRDSVKSPLGEIERLLKSGNHTALRELGIIHTVEGEDRINYNQLREYYRDLGEGESGNPPPSPLDPLMQRLRRDLKENTQQAASRLSRSKGQLKARAVNLRDRFTQKGAATLDGLNTSFTTGGVAGDYRQSFKTGYDQMEEWRTQAQHTAADVLSSLSNEVIVKADEIRSGQLIDVTTQKVITSLDDIKGQVVDRFGNTRITEAEAIRGLMTLDGRKLTLIPPSNRVPSNVLSLIHQQRAKLGQAFVQENGPLSRIKDLYLEGQADPVIKASGIRGGEYIDLNTGDVLETIDDISGSVAHISNPDEILVTTEEAKTKLVDRDGKPVRSSKLLRGLGAMLRGSGSLTKQLFKVTKGVLKFTAYALGKRLLTLDAYLPGNATPVLTSSKLKRGEYYDANGRVLTSFDDLRDGVFSPDGNVVLTPEEVEQLVNRDGSKHTAAKKRSALRRLVKKTVVGGAKALGRKWWAGTKAYYAGMGGMLKRGLRRGADRADAYDAEGISPEGGLLNRILHVLDKRLPKEGPKKGSTEWQLAQMNNGQKRKPTEAKTKTDTQPKGLASLLSGLFSKNKGGAAEGDGDSGDTNITVGDFGGGGESDKRKPNKPRGRFGRMIDRVKGSRLGQWGSRVGQSRVGQALGRAAGGLATVGRGALLLGGGSLLGGAGAILGGLGTVAAGAGAAILGTLASPLVLGGLAVGGLALGGKYLWDRRQSVKGELKELRLMQYGVVDTSDKIKVLKLETYLEQYVTKGTDPRLNLSAADPKALFDLMGIDPEDQAELMALAGWIDARFKPVYLTTLKAMGTLTPMGTSIQDLDEKLPNEAKYAFLEQLKTIPATVYQHHETPFNFGKEVKAAVDPEDIRLRLERLSATYKDQAKAKVEAGESGLPEAAYAKATQQEYDTPAKAKAGLGEKAALAGKALAVATPVGFGVKALVASAKEGWLSKVGGVGKSALLKATPAVLGGLGLTSAVASLGTIKLKSLTTLQAVRIRAYGRLQLDIKTAQALLETEALLYRDIKYTSEGQAYYDGNLDAFIGKAANYFGVDVANPNDGDGQALVEWLLQRFVPVGLAYFAAVKGKGGSITPSRVESMLKDEQKLDVARALMAATVEMDTERVSIWRMPTFFGNVTDDLDALKRAATLEVEHLERAVENARFNSPGTGQNDNEAQRKSKFGNLMDRMMDGAKNLGSRLKEKMANVAAGIKESIGGAVNNVKDWLGLNPKAQNVGQSTYSNVYQNGGSIEQKGTVFTGFAEGNGGVWDSIPLPKANRSRDAAMPTLRAVQAITGVDAELLATFASIESNFDYLVKASTSSATGWFQFINATWDEQLRKHGAKYGIPPDNQDRYLRKDPRINALMGAEFLKGNYRYLAKELGRAPTDTDLYCAHFMGAGGAAGFLKRDRNAIAAALYPKEAAANRSIYFKATGQPRTIGEIYALFDAKVAMHRRGGSGVDVGKSPAGAPDSQAAADQQAQAMAKSVDLKDVTPDEEGGVVKEGGTGITDTSIQMVADRAAAPLRTTDPSRSSTPTVTGTGNTPIGSGQNDPAHNQAIEANLTRAAQADRAAAEVVKQKQAVTQTSIAIAERQLETQVQMRDLLRGIAERMDKRHASSATATPAVGNSGNDMGNTQSAVRERKPGNKPLPISFQR